MIRLKLITLMLIVSISVFSTHAQDLTATLSNGKKVILHSDKTWAYAEGIVYNFDSTKLRDNQIPDFLRQGIPADKETLKVAVEMYLQGWRYSMPNPKSPQAAWGNSDGRTTWFKGWWYNEKDSKFSRTTPRKQQSGYYYGDSQNDQNSWSNGGSPAYPSKIDWLLSQSGGVRPR